LINEEMGLGWTAHYCYIERALAQHRKSFGELEQEIANFKPWDSLELEAERVRLLDKWLEWSESQNAFVDQQIDFGLSEERQWHETFWDRLKAEEVMVILLAHALSEALINVIIAHGLVHTNTKELFGKIEKLELREKWDHGPVYFFQNYRSPKGTHIYEALNFLCEQRNALVHYKPTIDVSNNHVLVGEPKLKDLSYQETVKWMKRFFRLPFDLQEHALSQFDKPPLIIERFLHDE
jgi:hypothetical protein